jgi:histidinol-phosphate aminotransferase
MINTVERKRLQFEDGYTYLGRNMIMDEHPEYIHKSLLEYFKKDDLHQYPDMWKPYEKLSNYLDVSEEELLITRGVEGAFKQVFEILVDKGDSVGILTPTCAMYHVYAEVYGINVIEIEGMDSHYSPTAVYNSGVPEYKITVEQIKEVVPRIKVLFLDNPKSHIPNHFTHKELNVIIKYCKEHGVIVFLDEVYVGWGIDSYLPNLYKHDNLIISSGFSKIGFASLRVGWLVTNKDLKKRIELSRDSYELNYFACKSIEFIIDNQDYINELKKNILDTKKRWYKELSKSLRFKVYDSKSYVLRLSSYEDSGGLGPGGYISGLCENVYNRLKDKKIIVKMVDSCNLVFSVSNDKKIEDIIFKTILIDSDELMDNEDGTPYVQALEHAFFAKKGYHGEFKLYWQNGNLRYEWYYKNGKRADGVSKGWYPDGTLSSESTYKDGEIIKRCFWYETGIKIKEENHKNGEYNGLYARWDKNGQKEWEKFYKDGELVSFTYFKPLREITILSSNVDETIELDENGVVKNKGIKVYERVGK